MSAAPEEERLQHVLDLAYRYLGHRDRTVAEVRRRLEAKHVQPAVVEEAVAELERQGYLDDARYARRFAEDRRTIDAWGAERIERRLLAVG
ncbi:MAG TPA: RecX family transcriptional regulator, partial [Solirubrobacteraceae bacterium]